jgi:hypothetical protein
MILLTALVALWAWFAIEVAPRDSRVPRRPIAVAAEVDETTAESLYNIGVALNRQGRPADALAYFERARSFRPLEPSFARAVERQEARLAKRAWIRFLVPATLVVLVVLVVGAVRGLFRRHRDRRLLRRLRLRGRNRFRVGPRDESAEFSLKFNHDLGRLLDQHPLTVVWSSSRHGKHMKSRPPVEAEGRRAVLRLDAERLDRLREYPGDWKGFFYLDGREVGEAVARVG